MQMSFPMTRTKFIGLCGIETKIGAQNKVRIIHNVGIDNLIDHDYLCNKSKTPSRLELN